MEPEFSVRLARSGRTIPVYRHQSVLEALEVGGVPACTLVQPRGERGVGEEFGRLLREFGGDHLRHLAGAMLVAAQPAQGRGVDERQVAGDELGERWLRVFADVGVQQGRVIHGTFSLSYNRPWRNRTKFFR